MMTWFGDSIRQQQQDNCHVQERLGNKSDSRHLSEEEPVTSTRTRFEEVKQAPDRDCWKTDTNLFDFGKSDYLLHQRDKENGTRECHRAGRRKRVSLPETCYHAPEMRDMENEPDSDGTGAHDVLGTRRRLGKVAAEPGSSTKALQQLVQSDSAGGSHRLVVEPERASELQRLPVEPDSASGLAVGRATNDCAVQRVDATDSSHRRDLCWEHDNCTGASALQADWDCAEPLRKRPCSQQANKQADMSFYTYNTNPPHASMVHSPPVVQTQIAILRGDSLDPLTTSLTKSSDSLESDNKVNRKDAVTENELPKCSKGISNNQEDQCQVKCESWVVSDTLNKHLCTKTTSSKRMNLSRLVLDHIAPCMNHYGLCFVDNFLGHKIGDKILQEVVALYQSGSFEDGTLAGQSTSSDKEVTAATGTSNKTIRGDKIMWVQGTEPGCASIGLLMQRMDKLILHADGKLGHYRIRGRHKNFISGATRGKSRSRAESGGKW
ncbi:egl nine homolog 3 isoform X2 [Heterodontus francisci]|uniref:egl nine homolog 3 isoform X2 n=1 Tax=Heterodontus francisci TaxID=7792 RepID=UPI00355B5577